MRLHAVRRTSPKGQPFVGVCIQCGKEGITMAQAGTEECPNIRDISEGQALLEIIDPKAKAT